MLESLCITYQSSETVSKHGAFYRKVTGSPRIKQPVIYSATETRDASGTELEALECGSALRALPIKLAVRSSKKLIVRVQF